MNRRYTTMVKRAEDMVKLYNEHMRGGDGTVEIIR